MLTSSASAGSSGGNRPGRRAASIDLPAPGGPIISKLWPPAAVISSARLAVSWPLMSRRSREEGRSSAIKGSGEPMTWVPLKWLMSCNRFSGANTSSPSTQAASPPQAEGQIKPSSPAWAWIAAGRTPETGAMAPSSANSPRTVNWAISSAGRTSMLTRRPKAMGRSKWLPSLSTSAGARLTVILLGGSARPRAFSAARTRSRDSATALSGRPTMVNAGRPDDICTWTSIPKTAIP